MASAGGQQSAPNNNSNGSQTSSSPASANLLGPNAALEQVAAAGTGGGPNRQGRRKSTLSGHGFFIDYSNTRRRSSSAARDHQLILARNNQILRNYVSPVRLARGNGADSNVCNYSNSANNTSRAHSRQSRASCSAATGQPLARTNYLSAFGSTRPRASVSYVGGGAGGRHQSQSTLLLPSLHVPAALMGTRKTSIFDPTGHSVAPHIIRRKSIMVASSGPASTAAASPTVVEPMAMFSAAASAASGRRAKDKLAAHVPVIGCSPTSIQASLAALDETRKYDKLLKRLRRHKKRKEKQRRKRHEARRVHQDNEANKQADLDGDLEHLWRPTASLRRKSLRAIQSAADLLSGAHRHQHHDTMDGLSISTMSFVSSQSGSSSCCSVESFDEECADYEQTDSQPQSSEPARTVSGAKETPGAKRSLVRSAMRKLAATISGSGPATGSNQVKQQQQQPTPSGRRKSQARSPSLAGGINSWYYYYSYLRENSFDTVNIDDLPIGGTGEGPMSDAERRARLYINYSLARIEILNSNTDPIARLASKLAQAEEKEATVLANHSQYAASGANLQVASTSGNGAAGSGAQIDDFPLQAAHSVPAMSSPMLGLFDFSQSTDVSLTLSTSTMASSSSSRNSSSMSSIVSPSVTSDVGANDKFAASERRDVGGHLGRQKQQCNRRKSRPSQHQATTEKRDGRQRPVTHYANCRDKLKFAPPLTLSQPNLPQQSSISSTRSVNVIVDRPTTLAPSSSTSASSLSEGDSNAQASSLSTTADSEAPDIESEPEWLTTNTTHVSLERVKGTSMSLSPPKLHGQSKHYRPAPSHSAKPAWSSARGQRGNQKSQDSSEMGPHNFYWLQEGRAGNSPESPSANNNNTLVRPSPVAPVERHSHANLTNLDLLPTINDSKRSASFANTMPATTPAAAKQGAGHLTGGADEKAPRRRAGHRTTVAKAEQDDVNEEELDDFERLNRCHKPKPAPPQTLPPEDNNIGPRRRVNSTVRPSVSGSGYSGASNSISSRNSNLRLSMRSQRDYRPSQHEALINSRNCSLSSDTLASPQRPTPSSEPSVVYTSAAVGWGPADIPRARKPRRHRQGTTPAMANLSCSICQQPTVGAAGDGPRRKDSHHLPANQTRQWRPPPLVRDNNLAGACYCGQQQKHYCDAAILANKPSRQEQQQSMSKSKSSADDPAGVWRRPHEFAFSAHSTSCDQPNLRLLPATPTSQPSITPSRPNSLGRSMAAPVNIEASGASGRLKASSEDMRERALSTGSGGANSQAIRLAASYARKQATSSSNDAIQTSGTDRLNFQAAGHAGPPREEEEEEGAETTAEQEASVLNEHERHAIELMNKNIFSCTLIGQRQTGKRTIVKCFVKILNEFRIAADEYKKEKVLSKLMDCTEKLQELTSEDGGGGGGSVETSSFAQTNRGRLNSWFSGISLGTGGGGGGGSGAPHDKRRLHSTAGISLQPTDQRLDQEQQQQQRRHTAIDSTFEGQVQQQPQNGTSGQHQAQAANIFRYGNFLSPDGLESQLSNKSGLAEPTKADLPDKDTGPLEPDGESLTMTLLRVPDLSERKTSGAATTMSTSFARPRPSSGSVYFPDDLNECTRRYSQQSAVSSIARPRHPRLSVSSCRHRRRQVVSLKELNRRRLRIKFRTRRHTSESLLQFINADTTGEQPQTSEEQRQRNLQQCLADSYFVVYAVNDRDSFEFARTVIGRLRSVKSDVPLPVVLVANKIDLERAKVVRREEGRALARKHRCKFIETSCTVGFNLDNLLVGLRTQLILKHHMSLNSIIRRGKKPAPGGSIGKKSGNAKTENSANKSEPTDKGKGNGDNILVRFYKKYVMDVNSEQNYDCDNFSKL